MTDFIARTGQLDPICVSVKAAADALSISTWQAYQLLDEQKIKSVYQGRRRLVLVASLREYVSNLPTERPAADADAAARAL